MPLGLLQLMFPPDFTSCFDVTCFLQLGNLIQFNMANAFLFVFRNELHAKRTFWNSHFKSGCHWQELAKFMWFHSNINSEVGIKCQCFLYETQHEPRFPIHQKMTLMSWYDGETSHCNLAVLIFSWGLPF